MARASAARAGSRLYCYLQNERSRKICQSMLYDLSKDNMPVVRLGLYANVHWIVKSMGDNQVMDLLDFIVPIVKNLTEEPQWYFRSNLIQITKVMLAVQNEDVLIFCKQYLTMMFEDNSLVRKALLSDFMAIADTDGIHFIMDEILPLFLRTLVDSEPSVRVVARRIASKILSHKSLSTDKIKETITLEVIKT